MPPKQPPTLKPISSDSDSSSEDNESQPEIKQNMKPITEIDNKKLTTKKSHIIESDSDSESDNETKKEIKIKEKKVKPDNNKLLADINIERDTILKRLSVLQKSETDIIKNLEQESGKNKEKKTREPQKPLDKNKIPEFIKKFIKCSDDAVFTRMDLSQEIRKKLILNGKEQIITKTNLIELNINEEARKELELDEVNKEELKEDIVKQLTDKKEKYYRVKFGKLLSIVSYLLK